MLSEGLHGLRFGTVAIAQKVAPTESVAHAPRPHPTSVGYDGRVEVAATDGAHRDALVAQRLDLFGGSKVPKFVGTVAQLASSTRAEREDVARVHEERHMLVATRDLHDALVTLRGYLPHVHVP